MTQPPKPDVVWLWAICVAQQWSCDQVKNHGRLMTELSPQTCDKYTQKKQLVWRSNPECSIRTLSYLTIFTFLTFSVAVVGILGQRKESFPAGSSRQRREIRSSGVRGDVAEERQPTLSYAAYQQFVERIDRCGGQERCGPEGHNAPHLLSVWPTVC